MTDVSLIVKNKTGRQLKIHALANGKSDVIGFLPATSTTSYHVFYTSGAYSLVSEHKGWVLTKNLTITKNNSPSPSAKKAENKKPTKEDTKSKNTANDAKKASDTKPDSTKKKTNSGSNKKHNSKNKNKDNAKKKSAYTTYVNSNFGGITSANNSKNLLKYNLSGIYGIPYQFSSVVDPRPSGSTFGSIYSDTILSRMPLLIISPGKVDFMANYKDKESKSVLDALKGSGTVSNTVYNEFIKKPGKYYTFAYDSKTYWKYVNSMNQSCAAYLGIGDLKITIGSYSAKLSSFKWEKATNTTFDSLLISNKQYVTFYLDSEPTRSESFSNSTTESQLASKVNSFSDIAKEVQFLVGTQTGEKFEWVNEEGIGQIQQKLNSMCDKWLHGSEVFKNVTSEFAVIATGGKLIFPEIWADSEFSQSYDLNLKLRCPNPNKVSWFLDICVPLNHLIALTLPRIPEGKDITGSDFEPAANGYMTPFLVRAFSRGTFNCDMGIITNLNISKGKEGSWSIDGLPSEVDVGIEIKDLYNVLAMTHQDNTVAFLNNNQFLNYLANSCGISINKPDLERSIDLWMMVKKNKLKDILTGYNFWASAKEGIQNTMYNLYSGIFKG